MKTTTNRWMDQTDKRRPEKEVFILLSRKPLDHSQLEIRDQDNFLSGEIVYTFKRGKVQGIGKLCLKIASSAARTSSWLTKRGCENVTKGQLKSTDFKDRFKCASRVLLGSSSSSSNSYSSSSSNSSSSSSNVRGLVLYRHPSDRWKTGCNLGNVCT
ncbi:hypothetical protein M0802_011810 [Mischocyttarus mexicanus]|nr:hypothetical protein M0802_011810 [Mischocyttarus mexicanus]